MDKKKILFICTHNSSRSQIAEGLVNNFFNDKFEAFSAGTNATKINPYAVRVMKEIEIDISSYYSKNLETYKNLIFDYMVTVCDNAKESCPYYPNAKIILHKSFNDPSIISGNDDKIIKAFRTVREEISNWLNEFVSSM